MGLPNCIYIGPHDEMSPEHYLPIALGDFGEFQVLEGKVCRACNNFIGQRTETQFLRTGPIALFRWMLGVQGRDGFPPNPFYRGASGAPPLYAFGRIPGFDSDLLLEVQPGTQNAFPVRQILFKHAAMGIVPVPILDSMLESPGRLRQHLEEQELDEARPFHAFATAEEIPRVAELLGSLGSELPQDWITTQFDPQPIAIAVRFAVTAAHFRAVAKIAFHYSLKVFSDLSGYEQEFEPIKRFIWEGERHDVARFVTQPMGPSEVRFERPGTLSHWMHTLLVERSYGSGIVAHLQFFAGPKGALAPYRISVGRDPRRIWTPSIRKAHNFVIIRYDTSPARGEVEDARPTRIDLIPRR